MQVLCGTCPLPFPSPTPVAPPGGAKLYVCDDGNKIAIYLYSDVDVYGFQMPLVCGATLTAYSDLSVDSAQGSAVANGYQVSVGSTGTIVGISLSGEVIPSEDVGLLVLLTSASQAAECASGSCIVEPIFADVTASEIPTDTQACGTTAPSPPSPPPSPSLSPPPLEPPLPPPPPPPPPSPPSPPTLLPPLTCVAQECFDSTTYSGALGTCSEPVGPGPCILGDADAAACPVLCGTCPPPAPSPTPVAPPGGAALYVCDDGNKIAIYMYSDVAVAGFQMNLVCGATLTGYSDQSVDSTQGSAVANGFPVSVGSTGTVVGFSSTGVIAPEDAGLLTVLISASQAAECASGSCITNPALSEPLSIASTSASAATIAVCRALRPALHGPARPGVRRDGRGRARVQHRAGRARLPQRPVCHRLHHRPACGPGDAAGAEVSPQGNVDGCAGTDPRGASVGGGGPAHCLHGGVRGPRGPLRPQAHGVHLGRQRHDRRRGDGADRQVHHGDRRGSSHPEQSQELRPRERGVPGIHGRRGRRAAARRVGRGRARASRVRAPEPEGAGDGPVGGSEWSPGVLRAREEGRCGRADHGGVRQGRARHSGWARERVRGRRHHGQQLPHVLQRVGGLAAGVGRRPRGASGGPARAPCTCSRNRPLSFPARSTRARAHSVHAHVADGARRASRRRTAGDHLGHMRKRTCAREPT
eukprot:scaffold2390_cov280-Prasinococcus_capsulatus_cf.AAC.5